MKNCSIDQILKVNQKNKQILPSSNNEHLDCSGKCLTSYMCM